MNFRIWTFLIFTLTGYTSQVLAADKCNYCEGVQVLEKAMAKIKAPKENEMQTTEHLKVLVLAEKVAAQIFSEAPKLEPKAMEALVKVFAKSSLYDPGNEMVGNNWDKLSPRLKDVEKTLSELKSKKQISSQEADRFKEAIAVNEAVIKSGNSD